MYNKTNVTKLVQRLIETKAEVFKFGVDVHAADVVVCLQMDGAMPERPIRVRHADLVKIVRGLIEAGREVHLCQETGPCGYTLHRQLVAAGATSYVIVAESLGDGRNQKTDGLDATALVDKLDRFVRGNRKAFTAITVPSVEEEERREEGRLRDQLKRSRHQWEARGKSLLLYKGHHIRGKWSSPRRWEELKSTLSPWLVKELTVMRDTILALDAREKARRLELEKEAPKNLPKAVGALTWVLLAREICNWRRFNNRRQVSSFSGLCPGVHQSGGRRRDGCINRYGNPRVRALLIELVWRLARWQPDTRRCAAWSLVSPAARHDANVPSPRPDA